MLPRRRRRHQCRRPGRQHLNNPPKHQTKACPQSAGNGADPLHHTPPPKPTTRRNHRPRPHRACSANFTTTTLNQPLVATVISPAASPTGHPNRQGKSSSIGGGPNHGERVRNLGPASAAGPPTPPPPSMVSHPSPRDPSTLPCTVACSNTSNGP